MTRGGKPARAPVGAETPFLERQLNGLERQLNGLGERLDLLERKMEDQLKEMWSSLSKMWVHDQIHSLEGEVKDLRGQIAYLVDDWKKWQEGSQRQAEKEVKASGSVKEPYYDGWQVMTSQFDTLTQRFDAFNSWMDEQSAHQTQLDSMYEKLGEERPKSFTNKIDWMETEVKRLSWELSWNKEARRLLVEGHSRLSTVESDMVKLLTDIVSTRQEVEHITAMMTHYLCEISCDPEGGIVACRTQ